MANDREYRSFSLTTAQEDGQKNIVRGHAATFDPYVVYEMDGIKYQERIEKGAFNGCDFSDIVFRIDHTGAVYARTSAQTLRVTVDENGLSFEADLSKTARAREIAEDIAVGNYPKASFAFSVEADSYEPETHTRVIRAFRKIYDVSPVTFPANPATDVAATARDYFAAQEEAVKMALAGKRRKALLLRMRLD